MDGEGRRTRGGLISLAFLAGTVAAPAYGECLSLKRGPIVFDVSGCGQVQPEQHFDLSKPRFQFIRDLDAAGRKKLLDDYRGLLLRGRVVKSEAVESGLSQEKGVLEGETVVLYMPPSGNTCQNVAGLRLGGVLREECCDGSGDPPCLLGTGYKFLSVKAIGKAGSAAGDETRERASKSPDYKKAEAFFQKRQWKHAVAHYERARSDGALDVKGKYRLAHSYRELENCQAAIPILEEIHNEQLRKEIWGDEEPIARKAVWLLARCYAKMNDPSRAVVILNAYLLEPQKYRQELRDSLRHKDFGWIHTSKEYRDYKKAAEQKLRGK